MKKIFLIISTFILAYNNCNAQNYKFGKVSKAELAEKVCSIDSTANAAILYKERYTSFIYYSGTGFLIQDKYFYRIKIYNQEGFDYATKEIQLHKQDRKSENVLFLKGYTYNLIGEKIEKTKLEKENIFLENISKYRKIKKFTMPNIKNGTIIEFSYMVESPFLGEIDALELQDYIPIKKLFLDIQTSSYIRYRTKTRGALPKNINFGNIEEGLRTITAKNIPAFKEEPYAGNIENYKPALLFELDYTDFDNRTKYYSKKWTDVAKTIYEDNEFGQQLKKTKHFEGDLINLIENTSANDEKILKILAFVKQQIKWNNTFGIYTEKGVKKAYLEHSGSVADINLNLVAMLRKAGFDANPVLVSTINHGIPLFPTRTGFNYVIAHINYSDGSYTLLDATAKNSTANILPKRTHNFQGRLIKKNGSSEWINLFPAKHAIIKNSLRVKFIGSNFKGSARKIISNDYLLDYRDEMRSKTKEVQISNIENEAKNIEVQTIKIDNLDDLNKNISENITFTTNAFFEELNGKIYISPLLYLERTANPFTAKERKYPIFFNKPWIKSTDIYLGIPDNYKIVNFPKSLNLELPKGLGLYKFSIKQQGNMLIIKSDIVINQAVIASVNYQYIKDFYTAIIKKQAEKIVLVKK